MPGYTVRLPYRVDEPSLGFVEKEMHGFPAPAINDGALLFRKDGADTQAHVFAAGAWAECWWGPFKDEPA